MTLDAIDRRLLAIIQENSDQSVAELAERIGLSPTPCWKRLKRLQTSGIITRRVALIDRECVGLGLMAYVSVRTSAHDAAWVGAFVRGANAFPEVVELCRMSGEVDYLLKVICQDMSAYDRFYKRLIAAAPLTDVSTSFVMEQIKFTTALPLRLL